MRHHHQRQRPVGLNARPRPMAAGSIAPMMVSEVMSTAACDAGRLLTALQNAHAPGAILVGQIDEQNRVLATRPMSRIMPIIENMLRVSPNSQSAARRR